MDRKEALKTLGFASVGTGLLLGGCTVEKQDPPPVVNKDNVTFTSGRQDSEIDRLEKIKNGPDFFTEHEMLTITALADIIIPADEVSGSASEAEVPDFIEFIVKDIPEHQTPMRGGLRWLDVQCLNRYDNNFTDCTDQQQLEMIEEIAYPDKAKPEMKPGVAFFDRMRFLTASGFYTTEMGIDDIGYKGNFPNKWDGVPKEVLAQYNVKGF
jgi:hypothetical protein